MVGLDLFRPISGTLWRLFPRCSAVPRSLGWARGLLLSQVQDKGIEPCLHCPLQA